MNVLRVLLGPKPIHSVGAFVSCYLRYGPSLFTVAAWMARRAPDALAVIAPEITRTFQDLVFQAERWAALLDIHKPRTVGILCRNHCSFVELLLACGRLGVEAVLLHPSLTAEQLSRRKLDLVVCDPEYAQRTGDIKTILVGTMLPDVPAKVQRRGRAGITILTSGTTGVAKPVRRRPSLMQALRTAKALLEQLELRPAEPTLLTLPLLHGHGLATLCLSLVLGSPLYIFPLARTVDYLACIETHGIKVVVLVPTILFRLLQERGEYDTASVRVLVCGSAPLDSKLAQEALECFGPVLFNLYGSSEAGVISLAAPADLQAAPESVGRVLPGVLVQILTHEGTEVPRGEWGRVCVQGEQVVGGKSFETGDWGRLDTDGRLYLQGRTDELLICGGENIFPQTIEAVVCQHVESVQECAAIGVPDPEFGQVVRLFVVPKNGYEVTEAILLEQVKPLFTRAVRPRTITLVEELPRNLSGKLLRRQLG